MPPAPVSGAGAGPPDPQWAGQFSWASPAANASTKAWATSSWYCTGGDFMK